eukprot:gene5170-6287_t
MTLDDSTAMEETASMFAWENSKLDDSMWPDGYLGYLQGTTGNEYNIARWPCRTLKRQEQEQAAKVLALPGDPYITLIVLASARPSALKHTAKSALFIAHAPAVASLVLVAVASVLELEEGPPFLTKAELGHSQANGARRSVTAGSNLARLTPRLQPEIAPRWQGNKDPLADASPSYSWDSTLAAGTAGLTVGNRVSGYPSAGAAVRDQGATTSQPTVSGSSVVTADSEEIKSKEKAMQTFYADMPPLWDPPESSQEPNAIAAGLVSVPHTTGTLQWPARRLGTHSSTVSPSTSASDLKSLNNPAARGLLSQQLGSQGFERSEQVAEAAGDGTEVFVVKAQMGKQILRF